MMKWDCNSSNAHDRRLYGHFFERFSAKPIDGGPEMKFYPAHSVGASADGFAKQCLHFTRSSSEMNVVYGI